MQIFAVLCLAAVALARPQEYGRSGAVTTVTERTFTIRGDADKYYGSAYGSGASSGVSGASGYSSGSSGYASGSSDVSSGISSYSAAPAQQSAGYSFQTVATAQPVQQAYYQQYQQAAPIVAQAYYQQASPAQQYYQQYQHYQPAAPAYAQQYYQQYQQAAPVVAQQYYAQNQQYHQAAPAVAYQNNLAANVGVRSEGSYENNFGSNYESNQQQSQVSGGSTKIFKHVYAFAAPEEPSTRSHISVRAPVSKRQHYKLVFIKAPSSQSVVDSDITLPAQEEEKTLIYVLSKNQKLSQPEIRIKQAEASKHAKPEVFFLKYKTEAEAQAIASGAINGQNANVPTQGEIISDGSVSILGQSSGSGSSYNSGAFNSGAFNSDSFSSGNAAGFDNAYRGGASNSGASNVLYRGGFSGNSGLSAVSSGSVGIVSAAPVAVTPAPAFAAAPVAYVSQASPVFAAAPVALVSEATPAASSFGSSFGSSSFGSGSSFGSSGSSFGFGSGPSSGFSAYSANREPASVSIKVTSEPAESLESSTASTLSL